MKPLVKAIVAICTCALACVLMVPAIAFAASSDMAVRITYAGQPIEVKGLTSVPHSLILKFKVNESYSGYSGVEKSTSFTLAQNLKGLRISKCQQNSDGTYTVVVSDGNSALPMTDGNYVDLGTLDVRVNGTLNYNSADVSEMLKASIAIIDYQVADGDLEVESLKGSVGSPALEVPFTLSSSSFASVVGEPKKSTTPTGDQDTTPTPTPGTPDSEIVWLTYPGGSGGSGDGADGDFSPTFQTTEAKIKLPDGLVGPTQEEINDAVGPTAEAILTALWDGEETDALDSADAKKLSDFIEKVKAAGLSMSDMQVRYGLDVMEYDDDVPANDLKKIKAKMSGHDPLSFYDITVSLDASVPNRADIGSANVSVLHIDKDVPLRFTMEVPEDKMSEGKKIAAAYVHDGTANQIASGVTTDEEAHAVTFPAWEFSTYGVFAEADAAASNASSDAVKQAVNAASSGGGLMPFVALGIGVVVIIAALVAVLFLRHRKYGWG